MLYHGRSVFIFFITLWNRVTSYNLYIFIWFRITNLNSIWARVSNNTSHNRNSLRSSHILRRKIFRNAWRRGPICHWPKHWMSSDMCLLSPRLWLDASQAQKRVTFSTPTKDNLNHSFLKLLDHESPNLSVLRLRWEGGWGAEILIKTGREGNVIFFSTKW